MRKKRRVCPGTRGLPHGPSSEQSVNQFEAEVEVGEAPSVVPQTMEREFVEYKTTDFVNAPDVQIDLAGATAV